MTKCIPLDRSELPRIALISHCVLNSFCETPQASHALRKKLMDILIEKKISIIQLPCPELCFQALSRESIFPGDEQAGAYGEYCKTLLEPVVRNLKEYKANNIHLVGIIGIDTSPSCSVLNDGGIMTSILFKELEKISIKGVSCIDMPVKGHGDDFFSQLNKW
ncbi:MAG: hypothetical protein RSD88_01570 [Anaerovoracaceae bacterium]